ncbi:MAG: hypothetical protein ACTSQF_06040 [Candidatus Heimdallarchaeaceae archaeon]
MAFDIGGSALQFFLDIMYLVILYISKIGLIIGLMFTVEKTCKAAIDRNMKFHLSKIMKGLGLIALSLVMYLILV